MAVNVICSTLGFKTGNPQVGFSHTILEPIYTIYPQQVILLQPVNHVASNKTHGITDTRSFFFYLSQLLFIKF